MSNKEKTKQGQLSYKKPLLIVGSAWLVYSILSWFAPANAASLAKYNLSVTQGKLLGLAIGVPVLVIWLVATFGASAVQSYANAVKNAREGKGYRLLAYGIWTLVSQLILSSLINLIRVYNPELKNGIGIFSVYESAFMSLVAFTLLALGAWRLVQASGFEKQVKRFLPVCALLLGVVCWFYLRAVLNNKYRSVVPPGGSQATFGVNDTLIFLTIVPQYVVAWFSGLTAILALLVFRFNVVGVIYKQAFRNFAAGFSLLIGMSIFLQFFSQSVTYFAGLGLKPILYIIYGLLVVIVLGYIFVARGAKKLLKLETV